jgi:hypothetical protein
MLKNKKDSEDAVIIVVGKVVKDRVYCGPTGNWSTDNCWGSLKTVKYTFSVGKPNDEHFAHDFETAFKMLGKLQSNIAVTRNREHLLVGEGEKVHNIRFTANVFEERPIVCFRLKHALTVCSNPSTPARFRAA